jgi:hypothetical protein
MTSHKSAKEIFIDTDNYTEYLVRYDNNHNTFLETIVKPTNHTLSTFITLTNLDKVNDIYYLDSYLSHYNNSMNTINLLNPTLSNLYMYLTAHNLYRTQNEFIVNYLYDYQYKQNQKVIPRLLEINNTMERKIWKIRSPI